MSVLTDFARALAVYVHDGQVDKQGKPYIEYLERVANRVAEQTDDENVIAAAWLHDCLEDRRIDFEVLDSLFGHKAPIVFNYVCRLTRPSGTYNEYIGCVAVYPETTLIKLADLEDNLDSSRGPIDESLRLRYEKARDRLMKVQTERGETQ